MNNQIANNNQSVPSLDNKNQKDTSDEMNSQPLQQQQQQVRALKFENLAPVLISCVLFMNLLLIQ